MLRCYCGKSNKPFKAGGGIGFMVYYTIALFLFAMIWGGMMLSLSSITDCVSDSSCCNGEDCKQETCGEWPPSADGCENCTKYGPYSPSYEYKDYDEKGADCSGADCDRPIARLQENAVPFFKQLLQVVQYPGLLWCILLMLVQFLRIRRYRIEALQDYKDESAVRLNHAELRVQQLEKQATRLRRQDNLMRAHAENDANEESAFAEKTASRRSIAASSSVAV